MNLKSPIRFSTITDEKRNLKTIEATVTYRSRMQIPLDDAENEQTMLFVKKELEKNLLFDLYKYSELMLKELGYPTKYDRIKQYLEEVV